MSGYAKRGFDDYIRNQVTMFYRIIKKEILPILPINYSFKIIYDLLKEYYPFELRAFQFQLDGYSHQDKTLLQRCGKTRYQVKSLDFYLNFFPITNLLNPRFISKRATYYDEIARSNAEVEFIRNRNNKVLERKEKVSNAKQKAQEMEPVFLDKMMGLYDRKQTTQKDRVYIMHELYKYDCPKVTNFLQRQLNHEQNFQLREMGFKHLQDYGYEPKLIKKKAIPFHTKSKKKKKAIQEYRNLKFNIDGIPVELSYLIENSKSQDIKSYDYFISHSYQDYHEIQKLITSLNRMGKNVYCDWINDSDYLKRNLVCDATLEVINKRIEKSEEVLFVDSAFSRTSQWVAHELQYAEKCNKPIKHLRVDNASEHIDEIRVLKNHWYMGVIIIKLI